MKLVKVRLDEVTELEPLVLASLSSLEDGLQLLDNQLSMRGAGRPDILAVDADGTLVVIELKADTAGCSAVDQAIRYFEWAQANLALLSKPFPAIKHDRRPKIFLVAPAFEDGVTRLVRYLADLDIRLAQVTCVRDLEQSAIAVLLEPIDIPHTKSLPNFRALSGIVDYITNETVRKEFERVLEEMRVDGVSIQPAEGGKALWLSASYAETGVAWMQTRRNYFNFLIYDDDDKEVWPPLKLSSYADWEAKAKPYYLKWLDSAKRKS